MSKPAGTVVLAFDKFRGTATSAELAAAGSRVASRFGWASARIDDVANFVPARLTGLMFCLVSARFKAALACMIRDARYHRSPNAGWPEAAMAGALAVRLSGPRAYAGGASNEPWLNVEARDAGVTDLERGLAIFVRAMLLLAACLAILAVADMIWPKG